MADDARFLRAQITRIRRLLDSVTDAETERALKQLAEEYEARAKQAERQVRTCNGQFPRFRLSTAPTPHFLLASQVSRRALDVVAGERSPHGRQVVLSLPRPSACCTVRMSHCWQSRPWCLNLHRNAGAFHQQLECPHR